MTICCALIACKREEIKFTYSPEAPRAGQSVSFSNQSTAGEEWEWSFGDGGVSTLKSPSHTYKQPGTYLVVLKVDNKRSKTVSEKITVYDTIPTFVCADSVFYIYRDYTFEANLYNPYNYTIGYRWFGIETENELTNSTLTLHFTQPGKTKIGLCILINGDSTIIEKEFDIQDRATNSILLRTTEGDYRQRIFGEKAEEAKADESATALLDAEQDTAQVYNGYEFRLSELKTVFPELEGFHIASRKIYFRAEGLWVANIDGANSVQIDSTACAAMTLDTHDNRIYWANKDGVWYMPFIGSDNNKFVTRPQKLNEMTNVEKIAADGNER